MKELDQKAVEQAYIDSYHYSGRQKLVATIAVIVVVCGIIALATFLFLNIISLL